MAVVNWGMDLLIGVKYGVIINGLVVDADALIESFQVGRGIASDAIAGGMKDGGEHGGHRSFAVGSGNVDAAECLLRIAQDIQDVPDGVQFQLDAEAS